MGSADQIVLPLRGSGAQRAGDAVLGMLAVVARLAFAGFFLSYAVSPAAYGADPALVARAFVLAVGLSIVSFGRWGARRARRGLALEAELVVGPDSVTIRQTSMLTAPVTVPRTSVERVVFDDATRGSARFPLSTVTLGWRAGWLWRGGGNSELPLLHPGNKPPNVAILFRDPIDFPLRRRGLLRGRPGRAEAGVLVPVADMTAARAAFAGWPAGGALTSDDLRRFRELRRAPSR